MFIYGSQRFSNAESNNMNTFEVQMGLDHVLKVPEFHTAENRWGDVCIFIPYNAEAIVAAGGYPTHQDSYLPLWWVLCNHSKPISNRAKLLQREIGYTVSEKMWEDMDLQVRKLAGKYLADFNPSVILEKGPRKGYKPFTRTIQDCLAYIGARGVSDHDEWIQNSEWFAWFEVANRARAGKATEAEIQEMIQVCRAAVSPEAPVSFEARFELQVRNIEPESEKEEMI